MTDLKVAIQTLLLPGRDLREQFANAARFGFDAVEVAVGPSFDLRERFDDVQRAATDSGLPVAAICTHSIHDPLQPDPEERRRRFAALGELVGLADELGARGVVSVPVRPTRGFASVAEQERVVSALTDLAVDEFGQWARALPAGTAAVFLEPLNRFEAFFLNRVGQAVEIARRVDHPRVLALADLFHMNIEEDDLAAPLRDAGSALGHVHIADNNRLQPGAGCLPLGPSFAALHATDYGGYVSLECFSLAGPVIRGDPEQALPETVRYLRRHWEDAARETTGTLPATAHSTVGR